MNYTDKDYALAAEALANNGVVVIPVFDAETLVEMNTSVWGEMGDFPEYNQAIPAKERKFVLGGFGALGNPSSFHTPSVRDIRKQLSHQVFRPLSREFVSQKGWSKDGMCFEQLFDRICIRSHTQGKPSAEAWHRDVFEPEKTDAETVVHDIGEGEPAPIFGGWLNLNQKGGGDRDQYLLGIKGTHDTPDAVDAVRSGGQFASFSKEAILEQDFAGQLKAQSEIQDAFAPCDKRGRIRVPPGHIIIFQQGLVHSVAGGKQPLQPSLRLFTGFRICAGGKELFPHKMEGMLTGAPMKIPSGQVPPMFSANHYSFFQKAHLPFQGWGEKTFKQGVLFKRKTKADEKEYFTPGSQDDGRANKRRCMTSLKAYGMQDERFIYSEDDIRVMQVQKI